MKLFNYNNVIISIVFLIGLSLGWLGCITLGAHTIEPRLGYVSKEEILNLEKARVAQTGEMTLFKGKVGQAAQVINKIGRSLENKHLKVIFTSEKIGGTKVISLSKKVHEEAIGELEKLNEVESVSGK